MQTLLAGASGYAFKEWKGGFYPEKMAPEAMLGWYAERLPTVEINNTFYQMPKVATLAAWAEATPEAFRFAIKASKRITHDARLKADEAADSVAYLYKNLATLGAKRGPVLFQLPPFLKKDLPRLVDFLQLLPEGHRGVFEFRHESWFYDDVYAALKTAGAALCLSEREDNAPPPLVETAPWGYLRLRLENYSEAELARWAERIAATGWQEVHAYFMHEPTAPEYASTLLRMAKALSPTQPGPALATQPTTTRKEHRMGLMDILDQYIDPAARPHADDVSNHFDQVAQQAPPQDVGRGVAAAFRSDATPAFGPTVGNLFGQSDPSQQAGLLNQLIRSIGPGALSGVAGGVLGRVLGGLGGADAPTVTPEQASQLSPDEVSAIATHAQGQNDSIVDTLGHFYAQHPTLVKSLGAAAMAVVLGRMRS